MLSKILNHTSRLFRSSFCSSTNYANLYEEHFSRSTNLDTLDTFWAEQAKVIDWYKEAKVIIDKSNPPFFRWFADGELSMSYNCLDRHVKNGLADQAAILYESPVTNTSAVYTYGQMLNLVSRFASVLQKHGVTRGDRVITYMPNIPETVVAMHACARIGAVHSVVYGGFSASELATRIVDAKPKVIISASCGIDRSQAVNYKPVLDEAHHIAGIPGIKNIIVQRQILRCQMRKGVDFDFYDELETAKYTDPAPLSATDYLYLLYTSGTTGAPKGLPRDIGGTAVLLAYIMKYIVDVGRGDAFFIRSDIGWGTGHMFVSYGPQLIGAKVVLYEGKPIGTPDAGILWRTCEKHRVKSFFLAPTALKAMRKEDPDGKHIRKADLRNLKSILSGGDRLDSSTYNC